MAGRLALIIANGDFDDPKLSRLKTPTRDAEALAKVLEDPTIGDFDVTLVIDQPEGVVRRNVGRFYRQRKRSDLLLLYYSGHGIRDEHGDLYLATKDTEMDIASATALSASFVREQIDKSGSQRKVVVLDCCHSGAFAKAGLGDSVGTEGAFAGSGYGRVILTASDALELAWEGDAWLGEKQPSVFTFFLVEGLRTGAADLDGDGNIALDELYDYVYEQVLTSGHPRQTPHKWAQKVQGQIVIARNPRRPSESTGLPPDLQRAIESPAAWMREGAVGELERLMLSGEDAVSQAARVALEHLVNDEKPRVSNAAARVLGIETLGEELDELDGLTTTAPAYEEKPPQERLASDTELEGAQQGRAKQQAEERPRSPTDLVSHRERERGYGEEAVESYPTLLGALLERLRRMPVWGQTIVGVALVALLIGGSIWLQRVIGGNRPSPPPATSTLRPLSTTPPTPVQRASVEALLEPTVTPTFEPTQLQATYTVRRATPAPTPKPTRANTTPSTPTPVPTPIPTSPPGGTGTNVPEACMQVQAAVFDGPDYGMGFAWSQPPGADHYLIEVEGERDGSCCFPLVPSELIDGAQVRYYVPAHYFEEKGFESGSDYYWSFQALDSSDNVICVARGTLFR